MTIGSCRADWTEAFASAELAPSEVDLNAGREAIPGMSLRRLTPIVWHNRGDQDLATEVGANNEGGDAALSARWIRWRPLVRIIRRFAAPRSTDRCLNLNQRCHFPDVNGMTLRCASVRVDGATFPA